MSHFKFTTSPNARLNCCICLTTMLRPVTLACGHSGCEECFAKLMAVQSNPKFPLCKRDIPADVTLNVNFALNDITSKLEVYCTNNACQWKGTFDGTDAHSNTCEKAEIECSNDGCSQILVRENMGSHLLACPKEKIPCSDCGRSVTRDCLGFHMTNLCSHKLIPCPLGCGTNLPRCHVTLHLSECEEKAIQCTVSGCNTIVRRKNLQAHVVTAASSHAVLQREEVQRLRRVLHFKRRKLSYALHEQSVVSFCWKIPGDYAQLKESVASSEYRCVNGNRWKGVMMYTDQPHLSLQLSSAVIPIMVGVRIVLMPGTEIEKKYSFTTTEIKEGERIGNIPNSDFNGIIQVGRMLIVKFVISCYLLKQ